MSTSESWETVINHSFDVMRLDYVTRYTSIPSITKEVVSTHSYWVSVYSAMICNHYRIYDAPLLAAVQSYALVHDMVEMRSGDFVRTFKYKNPDLKKAVDETEDMVLEEFEGPTKALYSTANMLMSLSDRTVVKKIVKAADFMSLFNYMTREVLRGNSEIAPFYLRMVDDIKGAAESEKPEVVNGQVIRLSELYDYLYRRGKNVHMRIEPHLIELSNRTV